VVMESLAPYQTICIIPRHLYWPLYRIVPYNIIPYQIIESFKDRC